MPSTGVLLGAVGLTWVIEWLICAALLARWRSQDALLIGLINLATVPLANAAHHLAGAPWLAVEVGVVVVEMVPLRALVVGTWRQAILVSLMMNATSALIGKFGGGQWLLTHLGPGG